MCRGPGSCGRCYQRRLNQFRTANRESSPIPPTVTVRLQREKKGDQGVDVVLAQCVLVTLGHQRCVALHNVGTGIDDRLPEIHFGRQPWNRGSRSLRDTEPRRTICPGIRGRFGSVDGMTPRTASRDNVSAVFPDLATSFWVAGNRRRRGRVRWYGRGTAPAGRNQQRCGR